MINNIPPFLVFIFSAFSVGIISVIFTFSVWLRINSYVDKKNAENLNKTLKYKYLVNLDDIDEVKVALFDYYNSDRLQNRVSNLIGMISIPLITILGNILSIGYFIYCGYVIYNKDFSEPYDVWFFLIAKFILFIISFFIFFFCKCLTNRYPSEAKKALKDFI